MVSNDFFHFSTAYKNITEAIESARVSAIDTRKAVENSEQELYPHNGKSVIERGLISLQKSHKIEEDAVREIDKIGGKQR